MFGNSETGSNNPWVKEAITKIRLKYLNLMKMEPRYFQNLYGANKAT